ncbi:MAG: CPBP family intramembrane metalloprotease [Saprospiraceae bacterium]|nr:CPBP family intramembrane metalloprotease [Saprospiraceae bacterium]
MMKTRPITWLGLFISYSTITAVNWIFKSQYGAMLNNSQVIAKELIILTLVGVLFLLIAKGEKLGLDSIGLNFTGWGKSILLAFGIMVCTLAAILVGIFISQQLGWSFGESKAFDALSLWTITLVVIRAGVAEEVFMRGYLLERLTTISGSKWIAGALSLIPFALFHYQGQGWAGVLISFNAGLVLTIFYFWKRDLKANIIAHFLIDFIPNVVVEWF